MKADQLAREAGCMEEEAAAALDNHPDFRVARQALERMLERRRVRFEGVLRPIWSRYSSGDRTDFDGTVALVRDLGLEPEDPYVLPIVYELQAPEVGIFARQPYIDGWARLGCQSLSNMRDVTKQLASKLDVDSMYFTRVYRYVFRLNLVLGSRLLPLDTAVGYWRLLLVPRFAIAQRWVEFIESTRYNISQDTWNMVLKFCEYAQHDPALDTYDATASWPLLIDDFVEAISQPQAD